jgi:hypothetical protein
MPTPRTLLAIALIVTGVMPLAAQTTPPRGSPERTALLDALRPTLVKEIGGPIELVVTIMRVVEPWAYLHVKPTRPGGTRIDWSRTKFGEDMKQGFMSEGTMALLHREGSGWKIVEIAIGPSDVAWDGWIAPHGVPRKLFTFE